MGFAETQDNRRTLRGAMLLACEADQLQKIYGMNLATHGEAECGMPAKPNAVCRRSRMRYANVAILRQHVALFRAATGNRMPADIPPESKFSHLDPKCHWPLTSGHIFRPARRRRQNRSELAAPMRSARCPCAAKAGRAHCRSILPVARSLWRTIAKRRRAASGPQRRS